MKFKPGDIIQSILGGYDLIVGVSNGCYIFYYLGAAWEITTPFSLEIEYINNIGTLVTDVFRELYEV